MNKARSMRKRLSLLILLVCSFAVSALAGDEVLEEIIERDYPIDRDAKFSLKNEDGSVRIYGADISQMKLQAIKKAYTRDRLGRIEVQVAVQPGEVKIDTSYPDKQKWGLSDRSGTVDYVIILPWFCDVQKIDLGTGELLIEGMRGNEVHARLGNGRLFGHNCFTDMHLSLGTGGLDVAYDWWETHDIGLDTNVSDGGTRVFIPGEAQFRVHAQTAKGQVMTDFAQREDRAEDSLTRLDLTVGTTPNAAMNLKAADGSIKIKESMP
ncbi:MAG: hypothetical protein ACJ8M1_00765 [Chthoniobacterales bacterium]